MCGTDYNEKDKKEAGENKLSEADYKTLKQAPDRSCTDIPMCIIFFVFFCGMFATAAYGYKNGNPQNLITPFDSNGHICGSNGTVYEFYPYLHLPLLIEGNVNASVCVKTCPVEKLPVYCLGIESFTCKYGTFGTPPYNNKSLYNTTLYLNRYCMPTDQVQALATEYLNKTQNTKLGNYVGDLATSWWLFLVMLGISAALALLYLFLLRCFTKPIIYISMVLILILFVVGGIYVWFSSTKYYQEGDRTLKIMQGMAIFLWSLSGIYLIILLCCCTNIRLGIAIMEATSDFVRNNIMIFFIPLVFFVIIGIWALFWIISAIYVYSTGTPERSKYGPYAEMVWDDTTRYVWIYHIFGLFWVSAFIIGGAQIIIAGAVCIWYYAQGGASDDKARFTVCKASWWFFRYHQGSVAFGALIIAIVQMIKLAFEYLRRKYKDKLGNNFLTKCIFGCIACCILCLDRTVRYITKNAYIQVVLKDKFFCSSAITAFFLIVRNCGRFTIISGIGFILMFLGKAIVIGLTGFIAYIILMNSKLKDQINSPIFPTIVSIFIGYLVASIFLSVYSFASTAILHCYLLSEEVKSVNHPQCLNAFINANDDYNAKRKGQSGGSSKTEKIENPKNDGPGESEKKPNNMS